MAATASGQSAVQGSPEAEIRSILAPLGDSPAVVFVYGLHDHRVYEANAAAVAQWACRRDEFVGRADGVGRLWVNPLDWQRHADLIREEGGCIAMATKLRAWDGRLTRCWISSLRLIVEAEPVVLCYVRPVAGSDGEAVYARDVAALAALLETAAARRVDGRTRARLLSPAPGPLSTVH